MGLESDSKATMDGEAPPSYVPVMAAPESAKERLPEGHDDIDITATFANLHLSPARGSKGPDVDTCLAHLKLLHAIHGMKEDVGYTDGLWGLWDSHADDGQQILDSESLPPDINIDKLDEEAKKMIALSRIREKRWALFVARAVDRYEAWWNALPKAMLTEADMSEQNTKYKQFPTHGVSLSWTEDMLPPLDVLMVMHSHMLNPRAFLEDTIRYGLVEYWDAGMPWQLVNNAISTDLNYNTAAETQAFWVSQTGRNWNNQDDPSAKTIKCAYCKSKFDVPWTTCGTGETAKIDRSLGLVGNGYGDGKFTHRCPTCKGEHSKELLAVSKFVQDASLLLGGSVPMPGTILDSKSGRPEMVPQSPLSLVFPRTFPNRMIQLELRIKVLELLQPGNGGPQSPTMAEVRDLVEKATTNEQAIRRIDSSTSRFGRYSMSRDSRVAIRKMMSRYWENFSPFALDLCGAVMRQGVFVDKMVKLDWLHSPSARDTMSRLVTKYERFITIMALNPYNMVVPTLDVDLAWHTHQLSPSTYYAYTVAKTNKFIDHDDKIDEDKLSESFEWTTKKYQEMFGEVYSACTCWYCETIRSSLSSSLGRLLHMSKEEKLADSFRNSDAARLCPPDNSAHISAHNSVRSLETPERATVAKHLRARRKLKLETEYQKAAKRAEKKGRKLPPRDEYYNHWGYSYYMYGPFMYPLYFAPGMYYGWDPCTVNAGSGAWANCAAGTCGNGGIAAGACGGPGGCANGTAGGCAGAGGGCGGGGGGGGCGGGGGGGCGGGGGGC